MKSGSDSSLSEEDELKRRDGGKKETEAQVEEKEKESCSDEEKNKESIDTELEQYTEKGMAVKKKQSKYNY